MTSNSVTSNSVTRRSVLRAAAAGGLLGTVGAVAGEGVATRYAFAEPGPVARPIAVPDVLVVLSLRGGFDGLNAIVPGADPDYLRLRPNVGIPVSRLIPLDARFGMHPAMAPLLPFWRAKTFGVVHAVGQADASRSHFSAMAELERAAPGTSVRSGWIDRMIGSVSSPTTVSTFGVTQVGGGNGPVGSLAGPNPELVLSSIDDFRLDAAWNATERQRWSTALAAMYAPAAEAVGAPARTALGAVATTARLAAAGYTPANGAVYPSGELGGAVRDVARLIKAQVGLRVACLDYGQWDLHADMGTVDGGNFADRLGELSRSLAAFATDLGATRMASVTVVTLSEFGRTVAENGSGGTDHGFGNAVLMLGGGVVGGQVHGAWHGLADADLVDGDLPGLVDYRCLLAEVLRDRCGVTATSTVFPGLTWQPLGVTRSR